mmetsp:Transcript_3883/g.5032  ORF Transcript_3883/g.5032 Transcript_3883/m.5032 type:complete len:85 (-) Transcript_3883:290-544(-)
MDTTPEAIAPVVTFNVVEGFPSLSSRFLTPAVSPDFFMGFSPDASLSSTARAERSGAVLPPRFKEVIMRCAIGDAFLGGSRAEQ